MEYRVSKFYKFFMLSTTIVAIFFYIKLILLPLSDLALTFLSFLLILQLLLLVEAFLLKVKICEGKLRTLYFSIELSDIISIENKLFHIVIRTRWKKYKLPRLDSNILSILRVNYRGGGFEK